MLPGIELFSSYYIDTGFLYIYPYVLINFYLFFYTINRNGVICVFNIYFNRQNLSDQIADCWNKGVSSFRKKGLVISVIMMVLGVLCFIFPFKSAYAMEVIASVAILAIGMTEIVEYAKAQCM